MEMQASQVSQIRSSERSFSIEKNLYLTGNATTVSPEHRVKFNMTLVKNIHHRTTHRSHESCFIQKVVTKLD
jgi:hypothetical protein